MALFDSYKSNREKQREAFDNYFNRSGLTNRPASQIPKTTSSPSSVTKPRREKKPTGTKFKTTSQLAAERAANIIPRETNLPPAFTRRLIQLGYNPSRLDSEGNIVNPYGSVGLKGRMSFPNLRQDQIDEIANKRLQRFLNPEQAGSINKRFGGLFGNSEGESTALGPLRKQTPVVGASIPDRFARGIASMLTNPLVGAALSRVDPRGTTVVPQFSPSYDPRKDPRNQPKKGYLSGILNALTGGADPMEATKRFRASFNPKENIVSGTPSPSRESFFPEKALDRDFITNPITPEVTVGQYSIDGGGGGGGGGNELQNSGIGQFMKISDLNIDEFNNSDLREILRTGLQNRGSLFGIREQLFDLMMKNQRLRVPNFAIDGPRRV